MLLFFIYIFLREAQKLEPWELKYPLSSPFDFDDEGDLSDPALDLEPESGSEYEGTNSEQGGNNKLPYPTELIQYQNKSLIE